jgi:methylmalonyl-CoA epimerase
LLPLLVLFGQLLVAAVADCFFGEQMSHTIDHLGIAVKSLEQARKFYEKLGLTVSREEVVDHEKVKVAMVPLGESRIELLEATGPDSVIAKFVEKRGEGLHHVAIHVPDLASTVETLKVNGTRLISDEIKIGAGGHRYVFVHPSSASGVLVELVEENLESGDRS